MFTESEARNVAKLLKIDFVNFSFEDFFLGMNEESIHGSMYDVTNITNDSPVITGKIVLAKLNIYPNYYNKVYGYPHFKKVLEENLSKEEKDVMPILDDVNDKEC